MASVNCLEMAGQQCVALILKGPDAGQRCNMRARNEFVCCLHSTWVNEQGILRSDKFSIHNLPAVGRCVAIIRKSGQQCSGPQEFPIGTSERKPLVCSRHKTWLDTNDELRYDRPVAVFSTEQCSGTIVRGLDAGFRCSYRAFPNTGGVCPFHHKYSDRLEATRLTLGSSHRREKSKCTHPDCDNLPGYLRWTLCGHHVKAKVPDEEFNARWDYIKRNPLPKAEDEVRGWNREREGFHGPFNIETPFETWATTLDPLFEWRETGLLYVLSADFPGRDDLPFYAGETIDPMRSMLVHYQRAWRGLTTKPDYEIHKTYGGLSAIREAWCLGARCLRFSLYMVDITQTKREEWTRLLSRYDFAGNLGHNLSPEMGRIN